MNDGTNLDYPGSGAEHLSVLWPESGTHQGIDYDALTGEFTVLRSGGYAIQGVVTFSGDNEGTYDLNVLAGMVLDDDDIIWSSDIPQNVGFGLAPATFHVLTRLAVGNRILIDIPRFHVGSAPIGDEVRGGPYRTRITIAHLAD
jgi:hypothetical protein